MCKATLVAKAHPRDPIEDLKTRIYRKNWHADCGGSIQQMGNRKQRKHPLSYAIYVQDILLEDEKFLYISAAESDSNRHREKFERASAVERGDSLTGV